MFFNFLEGYVWAGLLVLATIILFGGGARRGHAERMKECSTYIRWELRAEICWPRPINDTLKFFAAHLLVVISWPALLAWGIWTLLRR